MDRREKIRKLISLLLEEGPEYRQQAMRFSQDVESQRRLLRSLMNVRYPGKSLNPEYLCLQDELLAGEREEKGGVNVMELPPVSGKATEEDIKMLESCYRSCLELAESRQIKSVVFCCISTGIFCFPNELAAGNAGRVREAFRMVLFSCTTGSVLIWAFCMFGNELLAGIFMAEPIADTLVVCTASVCFYFSFHRLLKSMENGNVAEK